MTLKEKFDNVEVMFESQTGNLKYDELYEASNKCEKIADDYAIEFAEWVVNVITSNTLQYLTMKELLEIFKKEKGL
jgi:hypothetical protein